MILTILMFVVALSLSGVAAFYSIVGLTAIFAAAVMPIVIMGSILEVAKLTVTVWLHEYWNRARWLMKVYLCAAVIVLMVITSMGIFGFLSKAHSDQGMVSGDVLAKISIYDEKIKTAKDNIDANRRALKQMDEAVDQVMGRSTTETGADKAVQIRRSQQKERARLLADIEAEQKKITALNEERAPIAAEVRKVEAEVGPIKYIAALIYGDDPDANLLERAVRWVIILLVVVFDPLAVMMLLAATESRKWIREDKSAYEPDDGPLTEKQIEQIQKTAKEDLPIGETITKTELFPTDVPPVGQMFHQTEPIEPITNPPDWMIHTDPSPPGWMYNTTTTTYPSTEEEVEELKTEFDRGRHAYLDKTFVHFENLKPMVATPDPDPNLVEDHHDTEDESAESSILRQAKSLWKQDNPRQTLKEQRNLLARGTIDQLPWETYINDPRIVRDVAFGRDFPASPVKGDLFINSTSQPTQLFKYNGQEWMQIDKQNTDQYVYNTAYIDYLIDGISTGKYDPELLTDSERAEIELRLQKSI
jgi:hypothetical protein